MKRKLIERKIGERFDYNGVTLEICPKKSCKGCYLMFKNVCIKYLDMAGYCGSSSRSDNTSIIFKEVKK